MAEGQTIEECLTSLVQTKTTDENQIIEILDKIVEKFGKDTVEQWFQPESKHKNLLIHDFVRLNWPKTLEHAVTSLGFNMNFQRQYDLNTALHLTKWYKRPEIATLLVRLGADVTIKNKYDETAEALEELKEEMAKIIWLDLELTSLDKSEILECAVIVTDKNLNELERGHWVIHFEKEVLDKLENFHQTTFKSLSQGGNGLFDDCIASKTTKEEMEEQVLALLKRHCPNKGCPLAGSSIHWDREVLRTQMPSVYDYLHYQIIDVSSIWGVAQRWCSSDRYVQIEKQVDELMKQKYSGEGKIGQVHRAMYDTERSMELLRADRKSVV